MKLQDLEKILLIICKNFSKVFIIIDTLNECDKNKHQKTLMKSIAFLQQSMSIRLFVTSHFHLQNIKTAFEDALQIKVKANALNLQLYLSQEIENSKAVKIMNIFLWIEVVKRIVKTVQKMWVFSFLKKILFWSLIRVLLVVLQIQRILTEFIADEMKEALLIMLIILHDAIEETLVKINK